MSPLEYMCGNENSGRPGVGVGGGKPTRKDETLLNERHTLAVLNC